MRIFLLALALGGHLHAAEPVAVSSFSSWKAPVAVYLAPDAPVKENELRAAIAVWQGLGHSIHLGYDYPEDGFPEGHPSIVVHNGDAIEDDALAAETLASHVGTPSRILYASVHMRPDLGANTVKILAHELGHALGYYHLPEPGHLMHPDEVRAGWRTEGLER